jgi:hypothetical protein
MKFICLPKLGVHVGAWLVYIQAIEVLTMDTV